MHPFLKKGTYEAMHTERNVTIAIFSRKVDEEDKMNQLHKTETNGSMQTESFPTKAIVSRNDYEEDKLNQLDKTETNGSMQTESFPTKAIVSRNDYEEDKLNQLDKIETNGSMQTESFPTKAIVSRNDYEEDKLNQLDKIDTNGGKQTESVPTKAIVSRNDYEEDKLNHLDKTGTNGDLQNECVGTNAVLSPKNVDDENQMNQLDKKGTSEDMQTDSVDTKTKNNHDENEMNQLDKNETKYDLNTNKTGFLDKERCQFCKTRNTIRRALAMCMDCNKFLCLSCENTHRKVAATHKVVKIKDIPSKFTIPACKEHSKRYKFFCTHHHLLHCKTCIGAVAVETCNFANIDKWAQNFQQSDTADHNIMLEKLLKGADSLTCHLFQKIDAMENLKNVFCIENDSTNDSVNKSVTKEKINLFTQEVEDFHDDITCYIENMKFLKEHDLKNIMFLTVYSLEPKLNTIGERLICILNEMKAMGFIDNPSSSFMSLKDIKSMLSAPFGQSQVAVQDKT